MIEFVKKLFGHVPTSINVEFILAILGIILGLISLRPKGTKDKKKISIKQADNDLLVKIPERFSNNIKVLFDNELTADLYELTIYLKNTGKEVLKTEDFHKKCSIKFGRDVKIKAVNLKADDEFTKAGITTAEQSVELDVSLLEPDKYVRVDILYASDLKVDIKFESNIIGGERLRSDLELYNRIEHYVGTSKDSNAWLPISFMLGGVTWVIELFIIENSIGIKVFDSDFNVVIPFGWFSLFFIIPLTITWWLFRVLFFDRQPWLKIKEWRELK